jgi:mono/diheme cytochrome c family protein
MKSNTALKMALWLGWPILLMAGIFLTWNLSGDENRAGSRLYEIHCGNCHMEAGQGLKVLIPPLAGSDYVQTHGADMACLVVYGIDAPLSGQPRGAFWLPMPGNAALSPRDIAAILNFVRNAWGNEARETLLPGDIKAALDTCQSH